MRRAARRTPARPGVECLTERILLSAGDLLVRFAAGLPTAAMRQTLDRLGAEVVTPRGDGPSLVRVAPGSNVAAVARRLAALPGVRYAEPDGTLRATATIAGPLNDPSLPAQWALNNANDVDIDAPQAWTVTSGDPSVVVAVIDSGMDLNHPDLFNKVWVNPGEIPFNGRDDDRDGKVDDVFGWNFLNDNPLVDDPDGHGTHVSGTIAAVANNGTGVVGVAPSVRIMPLKFISAYGSGAISDAVSAIYYAVDHGAKVINASWGGGEYSQALADAIRYAWTHNVVFVTAAGNESVNNDVRPSYPPNIRLPNVLSVAAVDRTGALAGFSNFGARTVDLAAPGVDILSTVPGGGYARYSGTSMAAPHVAGVVALLATRFPNLSAAQLVQWTITTAKPLSSLAGRTVAGGMVDAYRALVGTNGTPPPAPVANGSSPIAPPDSAAGTLSDDDARAVILGSGSYYRLNGGTKRSFVNALYRDVLGARPSRAVQNRWLRQMRHGRSRQAIARDVLGSAQAQRVKVAGWLLSDFGGTVSAASLSSRSDVAGWAELLSAGWSDTDVHAAILGSEAYWSTVGSTPEGFAGAIYADVLARAPTPDEAAGVAARLQAGQSTQTIARELLTTVEAKLAQVARWYQGDLRWDAAVATLKNVPEVAALAVQLRP